MKFLLPKKIHSPCQDLNREQKAIKFPDPDLEINQSTAKELFPGPVFNTLFFLWQEGREFRVVGGVVRDYLLTQRWGKDWDVELSCAIDGFASTWQQELPRTARNLEQRIKESGYSCETKILNFSILRIRVEDFELEITLPRIEIYNDERDHYGHSDFEVHFDGGLDIASAFRRRDFTVNAIALVVDFSQTKEGQLGLSDPFGGLTDLKKMQLKACDKKSFYFDPVRFLRMIRFGLKMNFSWRENFEISKFRLDKLTHFYVLREAQKSDHPDFFKDFFKIVSESHLELPASIKILSPFVYLTSPFQSVKQGLVDILASSDRTGLSFQRIEKLAHHLQLKKDWVEGLIELKKYEAYWEHFSLEELRAELLSRPLEKALNHSFFIRFFQIEKALRLLKNDEEILFKILSPKTYQQLQVLLYPVEDFIMRVKKLRDGVIVPKNLKKNLDLYHLIIKR